MRATYDDRWQEASTYLKVLGHPNRLALVAGLREPTPISQIELHPGDPSKRERVLTRQGIRHHLNKLQDLGLVKVHTTGNGGGSFRYEADLAGLYRVSEMLSDIASSGEPRVLEGDDATPLASPMRESPRRDTRAQLVLVHGIERARLFPLSASGPAEDRGWVVGSHPSCDVQVKHDPFVEGKHCEIVPDGDGYRLIDLRISPAGTWLNWDRLEVGGDRPLVTGDVVGVGRSLFVFRG